MSFQLRDRTFKVTKQLPAGAGAVNTDGIDLGAKSGRGEFLADTELLISAPVLTETEINDADTITYKVAHDENSDFSTVVDLADSVLVQIGAGGAGAAAATVRFRFPSDAKRYVRVTATHNGTGDPGWQGATFTSELLF